VDTIKKIRIKVRYAFPKFFFGGLAGLLWLLGVESFAQPITVAQWNGYTQSVPPADGQFKATTGTVANKDIAVLTRDATVANSNYAVNTDGVAASSGWNGADENEKYWIATFATTGYENLTLTSKQLGSNTGPVDFKIQYKIGLGDWTDLSGGIILVQNDNYTSGVVTDLELPAIMSDQSQVLLRWLCTSTVSIRGDAVASGGVNRLDVTVKGTAKSGVVDPKIVVSTSELRFNFQTQQKTVIISGENLTDPISVTSSNPSMFLPSVNSLPADASDITLDILFLGTVNVNATLTLSSGQASATINLTAVVSGTGDDGTEAYPYTVAEAQNNQGSSTAYYWVKGYIIGCIKYGSTSYNPELEAPFSSNTNILIADNPNENDKMKIVPVQLPAEDVAPGVRAGLNLFQNPGNFGKQVKIEGTLETYFGIPGMRNASAYSFDMTGIQSNNVSALTVFADKGTVFVRNLTEPVKIKVYDLTGKLIIQTAATEIPLAKGIYVVKAGMETFKVVNK